MTRLFGIAFSAAVALGAVAASASTVLPEPTVHFDTLTSDNNDGDPIYVENGYQFDPTSFQAGNCSPFPDAPDPCIKEVQQTGVVSTMTTVSGNNFSLFGFYFDLQGTGGRDPINQLLVTTNKTGSSPIIFQVDEPAPAGAQLYENYTFSGGMLTGDLYNGNIVNNDSYYVMLDIPELQDVEFVTFSTFQAQNLRIDDILAAEIPLPAAGWLMIAGLGGLAALRRKKRTA